MTRLSQDQGFTLIEVIVAAAILILVVAAGTTLFVGGADSSVASQRRSQMISIADGRIETIRQEVKTKGFAALAMSGNPQALSSSTIPNTATSGTEIDPSYFAKNLGGSSGCGATGWEYQISGNYDATNGGTPSVPSTGASGVTSWQDCNVGYEPLEVLTGGFVTPQQTSTASSGTDTYVIDTFVTDTYAPCTTVGGGACATVSTATTPPTVQCSGATSFPITIAASSVCADARRVTVAVILDDHGNYAIGQSTPVYESAIFTNPTPSNQPASTLGLTLGLQLG